MSDLNLNKLKKEELIAEYKKLYEMYRGCNETLEKTKEKNVSLLKLISSERDLTKIEQPKTKDKFSISNWFKRNF